VKIAVAPHARSLGFDGSGREVPAAYEVLEIREALERVYPTDAHFVTYLVEDVARQPRINKPGLPYFDRPVLTTTFVCDVDNPGHAEWSDELRAQAAGQWNSIPELATCGLYHTLHGRRIVQPLVTPIRAPTSEAYLRRWLLGLESAGIAVDWTCRDWTRHFRLPHVRRSGANFRSPLVALDRMRPIVLEPLPETPDADPPARRARAPAAALTWNHDLPPNWEERAIAIAKAIRTNVAARWHEMYLALGGALLGRQCPPERLPALIAWIAAAAGSSKPWSHEASARGTARRYVDGLEVTGYRSLRGSWPAVALALDEATATRRDARLRDQARSAPAPPSLPESMAALTAAIRDAPDGLTVISAECGIGKTNAAIGIAAERAKKPHMTPKAKGERAPPQSKTAISVDKNALAMQIAVDLRARGTPVRRVFGPLSVVREDGTPECRFHEVARPLVEGGQPIQFVLCKECEHRDVCAARDGAEGPDDARVAVGPHALLGELDGFAGATGLLVIDEPPAAVETVVLRRHDLADTRDRLDAFEGGYALAMRPVVEAFDRWIDIAEAGAPADPPTALVQAVGAAEARALVEGAAGAMPDGRLSKAPPIRKADVHVAKQTVSYAKQLGNASRVLYVLHHALTSGERIAMRVEDRGETSALVITSPQADLARALKRRGSVVVTDANAELHLPVFEKIVGYAPRFHRFSASDGAPIARTLLRCRAATRKGWFARGRIDLDAVASAMRAALEWAREDPACRRLGLITMRLLRLHLDAAAAPDGELPEELTKAAVAEAREKLGPVLHNWPGQIILGHYGAVRGLNTMADVDALITLGDPWPNLADARNDAAFLGLAPAWQERLEAMCRAELEQAHGRIRPVHRARPGRALHVGTVLPSGYGWTSGAVEMRSMTRGPRAELAHVSGGDLRALVERVGGISEAARRAGCSQSTMSRYCAGLRHVPQEVLTAIQAIPVPYMPEPIPVL
jgi:hypothetical protein